MTMTEQKKAVVPRLRFPEFRDAGPWEVKRLGELARELLDGDWIESKDQSLDGIRLIQTGNIGLGKFIDNADKVRFISEDTFERLKCSEVFPGDLLISRLPDPAGRCCLIPNIGKRMITAVDCTIVRLDQQKAIPYFCLSYCQTDRYFQEVGTLSAGSTRKRISRQNLGDVRIPTPKLSEQQKIADCLSSLDEMIEAQQQKLELLQQHKKGLLQQLFPREGETIPRLRFPEFRDAGPWEVKRLGEVADVYQPETISKSNLTDDGPFLVYGANGIIGRFDCYNHEQPQIAVTCRGSTCGEVTLTRPRSWITGNSMVVNVDNSPGMIKGFLYFQLKGTNWNYLITGSGQPQITGEIKKHKVALPSLPEQQKIADCLSSLDELIELQAKKLEALKAHKKGLMQQLFPNYDV